MIVTRYLMDSKQALGIAFSFAALHLPLVGQKGRGLGEENTLSHLKRHLPFHSEYSCLCACPVAMTALDEKNSLFHQISLAVSTVLALLGHSDILTILEFYKK